MTETFPPVISYRFGVFSRHDISRQPRHGSKFTVRFVDLPSTNAGGLTQTEQADQSARAWPTEPEVVP